MERLPRQPGGSPVSLLKSLGTRLWNGAPVERKSLETRTKLSLTDPAGWPRASSYAGVSVTEGSVLALSAAWACVNLLAGTIGSLSLMVYRTDREGNRTLAKDHPLYWILHDSPNADQTAMDFWEGGIARLELRGNMHARKDMIGGRLIGLTPIYNPTVTRVNGGIRYRWTEDGRSYDEPQENVFHVRGFGGSPLGGLSTITAGAHVFGLSAATNVSAQTAFVNGMRPTIALKTDKWLTKEQHDAMSLELQERHTGAVNSGRPFIAHGGMDIVPLTISPEDLQMLESRGVGVEEVCRMFGVPPHMVGHTAGNTSLGSSIEEQTLTFEKFTLRKRLHRIEQSIQKQLLTPADRVAGVTVEFNLESLLRGDSKGRAEVNEIYLRNKVITINEVRDQDNRASVSWGDRPWGQMQDLQLNEAGQPPALPSPGGDA